MNFKFQVLVDQSTMFSKLTRKQNDRNLSTKEHTVAKPHTSRIASTVLIIIK